MSGENRQTPHIMMGPGGGGRIRSGNGGNGPMGARMRMEKPKNTKGTLRRLIGYLGKNRFYLFALLGVMLISTATTLCGPYLQGEAIDAITFVDGVPKLNVIKLLVVIAIMAGVYALSALMTYFQGVLAAKLSQKTVYSLRADLFHDVLHLPISYTDNHMHGDIMSRMTNDVDNVSNTISSSVASLFSSVLTLIGAFAMMLYYSWQMTLIAAITIPLTVITSTLLAKLMRKYFVRNQQLLGELNSQVEEMVTGYKTVMAFGREDSAVEKFSRTSRAMRGCAIKSKILGGVMGPMMTVISNLGYLLIAVFGGYYAIIGVISIGAIQAILQYSKQFTRPVEQIASQYAEIMTAIAGAERVFEIMDAPAEVDEGRDNTDITELNGKVDFEHLSFSYVPGEIVLRDFDLAVKPGEKIAIVGATGSGKTTVVNLLTRFYDPDGGRILLDGRDVREIPKAVLRRNIAIVLQDTVLFSDTIENNIKYGRPDATEEMIHEAAAIAEADKFIERLPNGYQTVLSGQGSNLSQGQRQLLAICRAIIADPKILILDEATSNVDTRTEMQIQRALVALMKNRTSLIIAHRLSTIRDADRIVVIEGGRIAEIGNHDELLAAGGEYSKLYHTQFAGIAT